MKPLVSNLSLLPCEGCGDNGGMAVKLNPDEEAQEFELRVRVAAADVGEALGKVKVEDGKVVAIVPAPPRGEPQQQRR